MPPVLDAMTLRFSKNYQNPHTYTVCVTTHSLAKDLKKDMFVPGAEVMSFSWNASKMGLKLIFEESPLPSLTWEGRAPLEQRSVKLKLGNAADQLTFRPVKNEAKSLAVEVFEGSLPSNKSTLKNVSMLYIALEEDGFTLGQADAVDTIL